MNIVLNVNTLIFLYIEQSGKIYHSIMEIGKYPSPFNNIHIVDESTLSIHFLDSINTNSEKVWYNLEEISNIIKDYESGKVETN